MDSDINETRIELKNKMMKHFNFNSIYKLYQVKKKTMLNEHKYYYIKHYTFNRLTDYDMDCYASLYNKQEDRDKADICIKEIMVLSKIVFANVNTYNNILARFEKLKTNEQRNMFINKVEKICDYCHRIYYDTYSEFDYMLNVSPMFNHSYILIERVDAMNDVFQEVDFSVDY
jgi:hypothetical protein